MKKAIALLLAFALIGGAAFAQDAAPAAATPVVSEMAAPVITYGTTASFAFNAKTDSVVALDAAGDPVVKGVPLIGYEYGSGTLFKVEPWAQIDFANFFVKAVAGYKASRRTLAGGTEATLNSDQIFKVISGIKFEGLSLTNTYVLDDNNYADSTAATVGPELYDDIEFTVSKDNLEAGLLFRTDMTAAGHMTLFSEAFSVLDGAAMRDWYFKISDIFGFMNVNVGGTDTNWSYDFRSYGLFPSTSVIYYQTSARTGTALFFSGTNLSTVPVYTVFDLGKKIEGLPLTVQTGALIPAMRILSDTAKINDWLADDSIWLAADYTLADIAKIKLGVLPNIGTDYMNIGTATTIGQQAVLATDYYVSPEADVTTTFFGDIDILAVENLTARASFDFGLGKYVSNADAATTGTGTAADPYKAAYIGKTIVNFGLEGKYDLGSVVTGLTAYAGVYGGFASGGTFAQYNTDLTVAPLGSTWTEYTTALGTAFIDPSYTEATYLAKKLGANPLMIALRGNYAFENKDSVYLDSIFTAAAGAYKDVDTVTAGQQGGYGYYSTEYIGATYTTLVGKGKFAVGAGYTMYLGLPTAADNSITGAAAIAAYDASIAQKYSPLSFTVTYTATF